MRNIKVWFPNFYTEAHRKSHERSLLVSALYKYGIECIYSLKEVEDRHQLDLVFCGSFFYYEYTSEMMNDVIKPRIHYNWDMYPFNIEGERGKELYADKWKNYVKELRNKDICTEIIVPSKCTIERTKQYTNRGATVVKSSVRTFDAELWKGNYVLDCMRDYPDPNKGLVKRVCEELELPVVVSGNNKTWEEYKRLVAGCRFIVSAQYEASTGGLSALEAYALGKPVLLSNSPRHGGVDYFGGRAHYFQWDDVEDFKAKLKYLWKETENPNFTYRDEQRHWVVTEYSEDKMARELSYVFKRAVNIPEKSYTYTSYIDPYYKIDNINNDNGYIVWRIGTGGNIEILNIRAYEMNKGIGTSLIRDMLDKLAVGGYHPYNSIFGFTRAKNEIAVKFYESLGFTLTKVSDVYRDEDAYLFSSNYITLRTRIL